MRPSWTDARATLGPSGPSLVRARSLCCFEADPPACCLGVKNPVSAARAVLNHARVPDPLGRIPPR